MAYLRSTTKLLNQFPFLCVSIFLSILFLFLSSSLHISLCSLCNCIFFKIVFVYVPKLRLHSPFCHILSELQGYAWGAVIWSIGRGTDLQGRNQELSFEDVIFRMLMNLHSRGVKRGNIFEY